MPAMVDLDLHLREGGGGRVVGFEGLTINVVFCKIILADQIKCAIPK